MLLIVLHFVVLALFVVSIITADEKNCNMSKSGKVQFVLAITFIIFAVSLYGLLHNIDDNMPLPFARKDEELHPNSFIAERADDYLKPLAYMGPKVTGHPNNEENAVNYLIAKVEEIINGTHYTQKIIYDHQIQSGSFFLDLFPHGSINAYANIQNIIVKVHSKTESANSVLINTHFDTTPHSPGASDSGINVAVALEILTKLSKSHKRPTHNVIFLFNGAAEAGLLGSHAFLAHEWAKEVRVLINLDSIGGGGKEMLVQTGPDQPWLLEYYDVPSPHGNVLVGEIFEADIIPTDNDFRIFRDYGGLIGYNFIFTRDGYRHHTKYDDFNYLHQRSFQHMGDNILQLVRNLAEAPEVFNPKTDEGKTVFYDIFGSVFVYYSEKTGIIINSIVIVISVLLLAWACCGVNPVSNERGLLIRVGGNSVSSRITTSIVLVLIQMVLNGGACILSIGLMVLLGKCFEAGNRMMVWYSVPQIEFLLCGAITFFVLLIIIVAHCVMLTICGLNISSQALFQVHLIRNTWALALLVTTIMGLAISYVIMIGVLFNNVGMIIIQTMNIFKAELTSKIWPIIHIITTAISTTIVYNYGHEFVTLFIPLVGRLGENSQPEIVMPLIMVVFIVVIISYYLPLFTFVKHRFYVIMVFGVIFLGGIIYAFTPAGFPYQLGESQLPRAQRYSIYHTMQTIRNDRNEIVFENSGFYFPKSDLSMPGIIEDDVASVKTAVPLEQYCQLILGCGIPITNSRDLKDLNEGIWIPAESAPFNHHIEHKWTSTTVSSRRREYTFSVEGSSRIDLYLSIRRGYNLTNLSLVDELPKSTFIWNDQPTYYISYAHGKSAAPFVFTFTMETIYDWMLPVADISMTTKFIDDSQNKTLEYEDFLNQFPTWTTFVVTGLAQYESIVLT